MRRSHALLALLVASASCGSSAPAAAAAGAPGPPIDDGPPNIPTNEPAFPGQTRAPSVDSGVRVQVTEVAKGFDHPWSLAFLPDGRMLVTEKPTGKLYVVTRAGQKSPPVAGVPKVDGRGQGGLLDVVLGPDFATSGLVYWSYYEPRQGGNGLAVARGRFVDGPEPRLDGVQVVFRMEPTLDSTAHAGGRIVFTPGGEMYVTLGERFILEGRRQAEDLSSDLGKIVRLRPDGSIPPGNPFAGQAGARPEIWTRGHRNVLGGALDGQGRLWIAEMGPRGGDEVNLIQPGKDYGWPTIGYGEEYDGRPIHASTQAPGLEQPVYYWDPVISPSSLIVYSGSLFPQWRGSLLIGSLTRQCVVRVVLDGDRVVGEERILPHLGARVRDVEQGPDGALYLLTDEADGRLLRVTPAG